MGGPDIGVTIPSVFIEGPDGEALQAAAAADSSLIVNIHCSTDPNYPPDPCDGGVALVDSGDVFLGGLSNGQDCSWTLTCSDAAQVPILTFSAFAIEGGWDFLYLYDAADASGTAGVTLHGSMGGGNAPTGGAAVTTATGPNMVARYTSDG